MTSQGANPVLPQRKISKLREHFALNAACFDRSTRAVHTMHQRGSLLSTCCGSGGVVGAACKRYFTKPYSVRDGKVF